MIRSPRPRPRPRRLAGPATALAALAFAAPAAADQTVVAATVFEGGASAPAERTVSLSALQACPAYTGPAALSLYPGGSTYTLPGSTWTLDTVLTCGLRLPSADITEVQVQRPGGFDVPLHAAELTDAATYHDPGAPGALPVVSNNGGQAQNTYTRPWRGGSDSNGADQVTDNGPIPLFVYLDGPPLIVHARQRASARDATAETVALAASVTETDGTPVPASELRYSWTFSDGGSSRSPTPRHRFAAGSSIVTLVVFDPATGAGGTATFDVSYRAATTTRAATRPGGGTNARGGPAGPRSSPPTHTATTGRRTTTTTSHRTSTTGTSSTATVTTTTTSTATVTTSTTSTATTTTSTSAAPQAPATTPSTAPPPAAATTTTTTTTPPRPAANHHHSRHPARRTPARGRLVTGRLVAGVTPLPAAASPLTRPTRRRPSDPAAAARPASTSSPSLAGIAGGALALALLGLGAAREHSGRRGGRAHSLHR